MLLDASHTVWSGPFAHPAEPMCFSHKRLRTVVYRRFPRPQRVCCPPAVTAVHRAMGQSEAKESKLHLSHDRRAQIPSLPPSPLQLFLSECPNLTSLPLLPSSSSLTIVAITYCVSLSDLGTLPESLQLLQVQFCPKLFSLPSLPSSLQELNLEDCPVSTLPALPASLRTLSCVRLFLLASLPPLSSGITSLSLKSCTALPSLPPLPAHLTFLGAYSLDSLTTLPSLPPALRSLQCINCPRLLSIPSLPGSLKLLACSHCLRLTSLPRLPSSLEALDCRGCPLLTFLPIPPERLYDLRSWECPLLPELSLDEHRTLARLAVNMRVCRLQRLYRAKMRRAARLELRLLVLCVAKLGVPLPRDVRAIVFSYLCTR